MSKERERSASASAATRLLLSGRTGVRLQLRSNQAVRQATPKRTWRGARAAADEEGKPEEASGSSSGGGSAKKRGQSVAFKEGHRRWDRMVAKRELEEVDEAAELSNYLRGKASKIDFSDLGDGELNLIAAALFREQQRRALGESYEPPRASRMAAPRQGVPSCAATARDEYDEREVA